MADTKISALTSGAPAVATDVTVIARGGANYKLALSDIWTIPSGSQLLAAVGSASAPSFAFTGSANDGLYSIGSHYSGISSNGQGSFAVGGPEIIVLSGMGINWSSSASNISAARDTGLARVSAGIVKVTNGSSGGGRLYALDDGGVTVGGITATTTGLCVLSAGNWILKANNSNIIQGVSTGIRLGSAIPISWTTTTNADGGSLDTGIARSAAGIVAFTTGSGTTGTGAIALKDGAAGAGNYAIGFNGGAQIFATSSPAIDFGTAAAGWFQMGGTNIVGSSAHQYAWSSGAVRAAGSDTGLARSAAGVVKVTNGSSGTGTIQSGDGTLSAPSFALSPTHSNYGMYYGFGVAFTYGGSYAGKMDAAAWYQGPSAQYVWQSAASDSSGADTGLARFAAGSVRVSDGSTGYGGLLASVLSSADATHTYIRGASNFLALASGVPVAWSSSATDANAAKDTALVRQSAGVVGISDGGAGAGKLDVGNLGFFTVQASAGNATTVTQPSGADNSGILFTPGALASAAFGIYRRGSAVSVEMQGSGATSVAYITGNQMKVTANTGTATPASRTDSNTLYTNTGDSDGSTITLPNDPVLGAQFEFAVTVAQTMTINASSGESIQDAGSNVSTIASSTVGSTMRLVAVTGGSGAVWQVMSKTGTWA